MTETMQAKAASKNEYGAQSIKVLEGLAAVRKRPAMYIGTTDLKGLLHLVYEVVDNSVDEALVGHCNKIKIILHQDGSCSVEDNGRGIPVDIHKTEKISAAEVVLTKLHAGGKFDKDSYKYSGGLHGVGISVVNALSKDLEIKINKNGKTYQQFYKIGKPQSPLKEIGTTKKTGTYVRFTPDPFIFKETTEFNFGTLSNRFREISFLIKGLKIDIIDEINEQSKSFYFEGGIASFVEHINVKKTPLFKDIIEFHKEDDVYVLDFACQYNDGYNEQTFSFVNNIRTMEGGTHEAGFKGALTKACNKYAQKTKLLKEGNLSSDDVREGLVAVLSIKIPEPQFEGQTKTKLGNAEVKGIVDSWLYAFFNTYFEENPAIGKKIIQKGLVAQQARSAAKRARELTRRKTVLESSVLPGKLADCSNDNPADTELYIVEGDSAGGCFTGDTKISLTDGRDLSFTELIEEYNNGKQNYCYTFTKSGIKPALIKHPRKTKDHAELIKVTLDNNSEITCTPDHLFMLRDGSYKKANELKNDSLMPIYKEINQGMSQVEESAYYNHKVINVTTVDYKADVSDQSVSDKSVYDLEVEETHNFALAAGVFVHNSAKQGRDRFTQAILPLRGKIINVEKARLDKMLNNNEIKDLITAIGGGIGNEEFAADKARYHKIIIMTDADVDGSHIRILLLTFFFRHMLPLIERGYLFIAQPPLYKAKVGRTSRYLKDDSELSGFLFEWAGENSQLQSGKEVVANWKEQLENILEYQKEIYQFSNRIELDPQFCHELAIFLNKIQWAPHKFTTSEILEKLKSNFANYEITLSVPELSDTDQSGTEEPGTDQSDTDQSSTDESGTDESGTEESEHSVIEFKYNKYNWELPARFFEFEENVKLLEMLKKILPLENKEWTLKLNNKDVEHTGNGILNLCKTIISTGKSLMTIQRYKGLGEMNPDQLWETTMDPKTRTLLKVTIQDAVAADEWFTSLMGDAVGDRKSYIEKHAHFVRNLDV